MGMQTASRASLAALSKPATTTMALSGPKRSRPDVGIINLKAGNDDTDAACEDLYAKLKAAGLDPLYDDSSDRGGQKFARMDLIGLPFQVTIGPRGLGDGIYEVKDRKSGEKQNLSPDATLAFLTAQYA